MKKNYMQFRFLMLFFVLMFAALYSSDVTIQAAGKTVQAEKKESFAKTINVVKDCGAKPGSDCTAALQKALDEASAAGSPSKRGLVVIPKGTYYLSKTLLVNSNVYIKCEKGARILKNKTGMANLLHSAYVNKKGFNGVNNVTVEGGYWDSRFMKANEETSGSPIFFVHGTNLEFLNMEVCNSYATHLFEFGGVDQVLIKGCKVHGFKAGPSGADKEAIQIDVCHDDNILPGGQPFDDSPCKNMTIEDCEIYDYPRAIGSHSLILGIYADHITIRNNYIHDTSENAIYGYNYKNCLIEDNTMENVSGGIAFRSYSENGEKTIFKRNKGVKAMPLPGNKYNLIVRNNKIITTNHLLDKEPAQYGIHVYATKKYPMRNVEITDNTIKSVGAGINVSWLLDGSISNNTTTRLNGSKTKSGEYVPDAFKFRACTNLTVADNRIVNKSKTALYENGYAFRENCSKITIKNGVVPSVKKNGIAVYQSSIMVEDTQIDGAGENGISVCDGSKGVFTGVSVNNSASYGIMAVTKAEVQVNDSEIIKSNLYGILVRNQATGNIKNTTVSQTTKEGITFSLKSKGTVDGCTVKENGEDGIVFRDHSEATSISNNEVLDNKATGITVADSECALMDGNLLLRNERAIAVRNSTAMKITNNRMYSPKCNFEMYASGGQTNIANIRPILLDSAISKNTTTITGTAQDDIAIYAMVNGTKQSGSFGKRRQFTISGLNLSSADLVTVISEDASGNQVCLETQLN